MKELSEKSKEKFIKNMTKRISILKLIWKDFYSEEEIRKILEENISTICLENKDEATKGIYEWDNEELLIRYGEDISEEDLFNDEDILDTCTHECLHALLLKRLSHDKKQKIGTGFESLVFFENNKNDDIYMGEGINEGFIELLTQIIKELWKLQEKDWDIDKKLDFILKFIDSDSYVVETNILKQLIEIYGLEKLIYAIVTIDCSTQKTYLSKFREVFLGFTDNKIVELLMQIDDISNNISQMFDNDIRIDLTKQFLAKINNAKIVFNVCEEDIQLSESIYTPQLKQFFEEELKEVILYYSIGDETKESSEIEIELNKQSIKDCLHEYIDYIGRDNENMKENLKNVAFSYQSTILALAQNTLRDDIKNKNFYELMCEFISLINQYINENDVKNKEIISHFLDKLKKNPNINKLEVIEEIFAEY